MSKIQSLSHGEIFDARTDMNPSALLGHKEGTSTFNERGSHYFGVVLSGGLSILREGLGTVPLSEGMYFSLPAPFQLQGSGTAALFQRVGYLGLAQFGGPMEQYGRLCYIDNCRCTLLVSPARLGDPCLNLLTFPSHTKQTIHIHPTIRLGAVFKGNGFCCFKDGSRVPLSPGKVFYLPSGLPHHFVTEDSEMSVVAYHPDTESGPSDESHPMLNRTFTKF